MGCRNHNNNENGLWWEWNPVIMGYAHEGIHLEWSHKMTHRQDKIRLGTVFANDPKKVIDYPFGLNDVLGICCPFACVKYRAYAMWLATGVCGMCLSVLLRLVCHSSVGVWRSEFETRGCSSYTESECGVLVPSNELPGSDLIFSGVAVAYYIACVLWKEIHLAYKLKLQT